MKKGDLVRFNPNMLMHPYNTDWGEDYIFTTGELGIILKINWDHDGNKGTCFVLTNKGVKIIFTHFLHVESLISDAKKS